MYLSQVLLFDVTVVLGVWTLFLLLLAYLVSVINKRRQLEIQRIRKNERCAEEEKFKMRMDAESYERVGRYEEAAKLYEELGEFERARQCKVRGSICVSSVSINIGKGGL